MLSTALRLSGGFHSPERVSDREGLRAPDGTYIPGGTYVAVSIYATHRDPKVWGKDAEGQCTSSYAALPPLVLILLFFFLAVFRPERFLNETTEMKVRLNPVLLCKLPLIRPSLPFRPPTTPSASALATALV